MVRVCVYFCVCVCFVCVCLVVPAWLLLFVSCPTLRLLLCLLCIHATTSMFEYVLVLNLTYQAQEDVAVTVDELHVSSVGHRLRLEEIRPVKDT